MSSPWESIIEKARRTPSPHNTQPWRLKIRDDRSATLFMEAARMLPDEDTTGHFLRCAMGLFLEAVKLLSANAGFKLTCKLINGDVSGQLIEFAELQLESGAEPSPYPDDLFQRRMTSRLPSNDKRIEPALARHLEEAVPEFGQHYNQFDDSELIEAILQENIRAVFHDLNVRSYHDEIARWFRYSDEEAKAKADGLDYRCMGVPASQLKLMRILPQIMRWPATRGLIKGMYRRQLGMTLHLGVISGPFFDSAAAVGAGGFLMRFWLELAQHGLYIHPFGNLVTNDEARTRIRELTGIHDIWLVFRVGYTDDPPQSYRRLTKEILLHD